MKEETKKNTKNLKKRELSESDKEQLIDELLPYIKYTALRLSWRLPQQLTLDDLISVGIVGLLESLERYDEAEGKITTFVKYRIKGAMLDELERFSPISKSQAKKMQTINKMYKEMERNFGRMPEDNEIAEALDITLDEYYEVLEECQPISTLNIEDFTQKQPNGEDMNLAEIIPDKSALDPFSKISQKDREKWLADIIDELPEREKLILSLYYWDELTMKEISQVMDISEGRVCQLHNKTIIWLKSRIQSDAMIKDFF